LTIVKIRITLNYIVLHKETPMSRAFPPAERSPPLWRAAVVGVASGLVAAAFWIFSRCV